MKKKFKTVFSLNRSIRHNDGDDFIVHFIPDQRRRDSCDLFLHEKPWTPQGTLDFAIHWGYGTF